MSFRASTAGAAPAPLVILTLLKSLAGRTSMIITSASPRQAEKTPKRRSASHSATFMAADHPSIRTRMHVQQQIKGYKHW